MSTSNELRVLLADNQAGTSNPISLAVRNCDLLGDLTYGNGSGKRGTRQQYACGDRILKEEVLGGFDIYPTEDEMDWLIERMLGDNISGYPAAAATPKETLPQIFAYVDKGDESFRYDNLVMSQIIISIRENDYINWRINFVGKDETRAVTWPASPPALDCATEFIASDVSLEIAATAYPFKTIDIDINNNILPNQHENAVKRTIFEAGTLSINMSGTFGFRTATKDLYRRGIAGDDDALLVLSGDVNYEFKFGNIKAPGRGPTVGDEGEITQALQFMVKRTASTNMLEISKP